MTYTDVLEKSNYT